MPYLDLRGVPSYVEVRGTGEPLLLLHGGFCTIESTRGLGDLLATRTEVHAPERPGHGRTRDVEGPFSYAESVRDTLAYLDAAGLGDVHVVGFSDGAIIGLLLAIEHPERIRSVVSISANLDPDGFVADGGDGDEVPPEAFTQIREEYDALSPDGPEHGDVVVAKLAAMWESEPRITAEMLATITAPVLVMAGDHDVIDRAHTLRIADEIPGARLAIVPAADHWLAHARAGYVGFAALDFLDRLPPRPVRPTDQRPTD